MRRASLNSPAGQDLRQAEVITPELWPQPERLAPQAALAVPFADVLVCGLTPELRRTALRRRVGLITRTYHDAAKRCRLGRIVRRLTSELLERGPRIPQEGSQAWASCTEQVLCASELFTRVRDHRRSAAAFKLHGVCGRLATRAAMTLGGRSSR